MNKIISLLFLLCIVGSSIQVFTPKEMLDAINFARTQPKLFAETAKLNTRWYKNGAFVPYTTSSPTTPPESATCYQDGYNWLLNVAVGVPALLQSQVAELAAASQSIYLANVLKKLSHTGEGGSQFWERLQSFGSYATGAWGSNENIASTSAPWASANDYVFQWISDCGTLSRGHRTNIFSTAITHYGCADVQDPLSTWTYATCDGSTAMILLASAKTSPLYARLYPAGL